MSVYSRRSQGAKGNEDNLKRLPAGKSTEEGKDHVSDHFKHYLLKCENEYMHDPLMQDPNGQALLTQKYLNMQNMGTGNIQINTLEADNKDSRMAHIGIPTTLKGDISGVLGFQLGLLKPFTNLPEQVTVLELQSGREAFLRCITYLNSLRQSFSTRFDASFFRQFYLHLKHLDEAKTGWLPKNDVYDFCTTKYVKFDPALIEPLLRIWNAFDGYQIEYKTFVHVINYGEPSSCLPIVPDVSAECLEFSTTYNDMVKIGQKDKMSIVTGMPSERYLRLDNSYPVIPTGLCKDIFLPKESDIISCLIPKQPNYLTLLGVSPQDMYSTRSPEMIRTVSEAAGVIFSDDKFNEIWDEAKTYHSHGLVSYETFKKAFLKSTYNV